MAACCALLLIVGLAYMACRGKQRLSLQASVDRAAGEIGIPRDLLISMAYAESRLSLVGPESSQCGWIRLVPWRAARDPRVGARLLGVSVDEVLTNPTTGMRAAAKLLAAAATTVPPNLPTSEWGPALARFNGGRDPGANALYAEGVLLVRARGFRGVDGEGNAIVLPASTAAGPPNLLRGDRDAGIVGASFVSYYPAAESGFRRCEGPLRHVQAIVIHTAQNTFPTTLDQFRRPGVSVSAHYLIRALDGATVQMVDERNVAFHAACFNDESIGIEHEGYVSAPELWYTEELYRASARLVADIARRHGVPLDRSHILGHRETSACSDHTDPGPGWDWPRFMAYVTAER